MLADQTEAVLFVKALSPWIEFPNTEPNCVKTIFPREFKLLEVLLRHQGQVVTRTMMLEEVWDYHFDPGTNVIDVHISRLRKKIDEGKERPLLHTVRGVGYMVSEHA